ncbi:MAG: hypothetical protein MMC33_001923 [Icmadophila ericetorum]|nr:hypothetical protein [Icmadophila ericetorum]
MATSVVDIEERAMPSETTRLLSPDSSTPPPPSSVDPASAVLLDSSKRKKSSIFLQLAPFARLYESIICKDYYQEHDPSFIDENGNVDEQHCKLAPIQAELVTVQGGQMLFDSIVGALLALPYGMISDRYGRKPVAILSICGLIMSNIWILSVCYFDETFPLRWIWFSAVFTIIGGGQATAGAAFFSILADSTSMTERSTTFFRVGSAMLLAEVTGVPISAALMIRNIWMPSCIAIGIELFGVLLMIFTLPETLHSNEQGQEDPDLSTNGRAGDILKAKHGHRLHDNWKKVKVAVDNVLRDSAFIFRSPELLLLLSTFFVHILGRVSLGLILQYTSKKFGWTIAQASFLLSLRAAVNLILLLLILPAISHLLTSKLHMQAKTKDLHVARWSALLLATGDFTIAFSPNLGILTTGLFIYALGSGFSAVVRSLVTQTVKPDEIGRLSAVISIVDTIGAIFSGPFLAATYRWGLSLGGPWIGMPFLTTGGLFVITLVAVLIVRMN